MDKLLNQSNQIKILLFGDYLTGKSSLLIRYFQDKFYDYPDLFRREFYQKILKSGKDEINLYICEFDSNERMYYIKQFFYRTSSFIIICYDVTNRQSFQKAYNWYLDFKNSSNNKYVVLSLIGNKCDLQEEHRQVSYQEAQQLAQSLGMVFFEISAKTGYHVNELFDFIITQAQNIA
uniref:Rab-family small GTPase RabX1E n=1 Tax=Tetrahymena thermophila TaxID=5911 RepID=E1CB28_TETTH|nr:Rab-family small GTPase RabX1E [Tetrahymena thermophila]